VKQGFPAHTLHTINWPEHGSSLHLQGGDCVGMSVALVEQIAVP
jgi:hypothetical protein